MISQSVELPKGNLNDVRVARKCHDVPCRILPDFQVRVFFAFLCTFYLWDDVLPAQLAALRDVVRASGYLGGTLTKVSLNLIRIRSPNKTRLWFSS